MPYAKAEEPLIKDLYFAEAFEHSDFISADGIPGNFKIHLPEALHRNSKLNCRFIIPMAEMLKDTDAITGVKTGGYEMATEIAWELGKPLIEVDVHKVNGKKEFRLDDGAAEIIQDCKVIGVAEDVTSTGGSLLKVAELFTTLGIGIKSAIGFRRGLPAPKGMTSVEIAERNKNPDYAGRPPFEYPVPCELQTVIHRPIPLFLRKKWYLGEWLPELKEIDGALR